MKFDAFHSKKYGGTVFWEQKIDGDDDGGKFKIQMFHYKQFNVHWKLLSPSAVYYALIQAKVLFQVNFEMLKTSTLTLKNFLSKI